jgi:hypothetical protein
MPSKPALTAILAGLLLSAPLTLAQSDDPGGAQLQAPATNAPDASADAPIPKSVDAKHKHGKKKKKAHAAAAKTR